MGLTNNQIVLFYTSLEVSRKTLFKTYKILVKNEFHHQFHKKACRRYKPCMIVVI